MSLRDLLASHPTSTDIAMFLELERVDPQLSKADREALKIARFEAMKREGKK